MHFAKRNLPIIAVCKRRYRSRGDGNSPPRRLAAAGFGKFQPLDQRDDEIAYRRNRHIEFKLTQC